MKRDPGLIWSLEQLKKEELASENSWWKLTLVHLDAADQTAYLVKVIDLVPVIQGVEPYTMGPALSVLNKESHQSIGGKQADQVTLEHLSMLKTYVANKTKMHFTNI